jgi:hypothetical protein
MSRAETPSWVPPQPRSEPAAAVAGGARAWWADVEHLRDAAETRHSREGRALRSVAAPEPSVAAPVRRRAAAAPPAQAPSRRLTPAPRRRTVEITGRTVPAPLVPRTAEPSPGGRRRPPRTPAQRIGGRPDRVAMWAPLLGFVLLLVAAISNHG